MAALLDCTSKQSPDVMANCLAMVMAQLASFFDSDPFFVEILPCG